MSELEDLARACRILAAEGHDDFTMGHLSLRADEESFWLKRAFIGLAEVTGPNDFMRVSYDGAVLAGEGVLHREWPIHAEVLRARPDVGVVGHTHPTWATRLSASSVELQPVANYGVLFPDGLPRFELTSDLIYSTEQGAALAQALGSAPAALMRNHGIVFCGKTPGRAAVTAIYTERAAQDFLTLTASGLEFSVPSRTELEAKGSRTVAPMAFDRFWAYLCRTHGEAQA